MLRHCQANPQLYLGDPYFAAVARDLHTQAQLRPASPSRRFDARDPQLDEILGVLDQHERIKHYTVLPDTQPAWGVPLGVVLDTQQAIFPTAVGRDIGCRMVLSSYDLNPSLLNRRNERDHLKRLLSELTHFGESWPDSKSDHPIFQDPTWKTDPALTIQKDQARWEFATCGGGNHFVSIGKLELDGHPQLALLSHWGSRQLGRSFHDIYQEQALAQNPGPRQSRQTAWFEAGSDIGQAYLRGQNLIQQYVQTGHQHLHQQLAEALGTTCTTRWDFPHNFVERLDDAVTYRHRKGACFLNNSQLGLIAGSLTQPSLLVQATDPQALAHSLPHGTGRRMGRAHARKTLTAAQLKAALKEANVELIGGSLCEHPHAYRSTEDTLTALAELIQPIGRFTPAITRMGTEDSDTA